MSIFRRRLMMGQEKAYPYDDFGYVKKGKTFHLDGISIGDNANAWTDLVGGIIFPLVNGVTHDIDHFNFASEHGVMESSPHTQLDFDTTGTLEVVTNYYKNGGVIYSGKNYTLSFIFIGDAVISYISSREKANIYDVHSYTNPTQFSVSFNSLYANGVQLERSGTDFFKYAADYAVIGNGNQGTNRPYIGNIYAIRYYNRVLSDVERNVNLAIDNERFNLGLDL